MSQSNQKRYEIRQLRPEEGEQAIRIEHTCFPPNEACRAERILERIRKAPELFLAAVDSETGKCAGMINGIATNEKVSGMNFLRISLCIIQKANRSSF